MSLTDRTASMVHRVLTSRDDRRDRHKDVLDRAGRRQQRAKEVLDASVTRGDRRRAEVSALLRQIEQRHHERSVHLARLGVQQPTPEQPRPAVEVKQDAPAARPVEDRLSTHREHLRRRHAPPRKGSGDR